MLQLQTSYPQARPLPIMRKKRGGEGGEPKNVVERALENEHVGGSLSELARQLSKYSGEEVTRQRVHGWRLRGTFPREMIEHVERLTGISIVELVTARPRDRDQGNVVVRAMRLMGEGTTPAKFAEALSKESGEKVTRQMVSNWLTAEQFPMRLTPYIHLLTRIPVRDLIEAGRKGKGKQRK